MEMKKMENEVEQLINANELKVNRKKFNEKNGELRKIDGQYFKKTKNKKSKKSKTCRNE